MKGIYDPCHAAGGMTAYEWCRDPKRIGFILARYKFVAKMFAGYGNVLEVGCADGFGTRVVAQTVGHVAGIDIDKDSIGEALEGNDGLRNVIFMTANVLTYRTTVHQPYDAAYCLDVIEHIKKKDTTRFLSAMARLAPVAIIGSPSLESQKYASALSKKGHVNCMTAATLKDQCEQHWKRVFMFGMNDEVLHTGFDGMRQYNFALCVS